MSNSEEDWTYAEGFKWRKYPTEEIVVQLLPLTSSAPAGGDKIVRRIAITSAQIDDLFLDLTIFQADSYMPICTLDIALKKPSRGIDLAGLLIEAEAGRWKATGTTNEAGQLNLTGLLEHQINHLSLIIG